MMPRPLVPHCGTLHEADRRSPAYLFCRALLWCALFSIIFQPEFVRVGGEGQSPIYHKMAAGFRIIDVLLLALVLSHVVAWGCLRRRRLTFPRSLAAPGIAFLGCIAMAAAYGASRGGSNFFFDWRGLALGIGLFVVWSFWLQRPSDVAAALHVFLAYAGIRIALLFVLYLWDEADTLGGVAIPTFDGPMISCAVFAALLAFSLRERGPRKKLLYACLGLAACLFVLLCLRRTYWGELAIGGVILLLLRGRTRGKSFALAIVAIAIAAGILGSTFSQRVQSLDVSRDDTQFSADNADHVLDLVDAWSEIRQSPVMGIGLGTSYPTWQIRNWKPESVMVHNAPLHVWLKYGIAGLICYLWFHIALLTWLYRQSRAAPGRSTALLAAAFAYFTAQFVMTLGFAPWPYSELQLTTLMSFVIAAAASASATSYPKGFAMLRHQTSSHFVLQPRSPLPVSS